MPCSDSVRKHAKRLYDISYRSKNAKRIKARRSAYNKGRRIENREYRRKYRTIHREQCKQWEREYYLKNKAAYAERAKRNRRSRPTIYNAAVDRWRKRNPNKVRAQWKIKDAIKRGLIVRLPCIVCGSIKSHGHHADYSKTLDVVWLCALHHKHKHLKEDL